MNTCAFCQERPAVATMIVTPEPGFSERKPICFECQRDNVVSSERTRSVVAIGDLFGEAFASADFSSFETEWDHFDAYNRRAPKALPKYDPGHVSVLETMCDAAMKAADKMARSGRGRLFVAGGPGVGKTHMLAAISRRLLAEGRTIAVRSAYDFVSEMLSVLSSRPHAERQAQSEIIADLCRYDAVVIDDLNPEVITDSTPRYIGWLFMELVRRNNILMVASQLSINQLSQDRIGTKPGLGEGIMDRLRSSPSTVLRIPSGVPSYRQVQLVINNDAQ